MDRKTAFEIASGLNTQNSRPEPLTFWEWECPECEYINPRSDADLQARGWIGTIQCARCKRRFELSGLWSHGFAQETEAQS